MFAPTDDAFAALPDGVIESVLEPRNHELLVRILKHHVVAGTVYLDQAATAGAAETLAGTSLRFGYSESAFRVGPAGIVTADVPAANGVIHVIDRVLLPEGMAFEEQGQKAVPQRSARQIIADAIDAGAPLFNGGDPAACRDIYRAAVSELLQSHRDRLSSAARRQLQTSLQAPADDPDGAKHAWKLRNAMDLAYRYLNESF